MPIKSFAAEASISSDTPQLLRKPEKVDCVGLQVKIDRIKKGLPFQRENIQKQRALIDAAKEESNAAYEKAMEDAKARALDAAKDLPKNILEDKMHALHEFKALRARLKALEAAGVPATKAADYLRQTKSLDNLIDKIGKADDMATVGNDLMSMKLKMQGMKNQVTSMQEQLAQWSKFASETGLSDDIGKIFAGLGGSLASLTYELANADMILAEGLAGQMIAEQDLPKLEESLNTMEAQNKALDFHLVELERALDEATTSGKCLNSPSKKVSKAESPSTSDKLSRVKSSSGSGAGDALLIGVGVAAIAGGAIALGSALGNMSTTTTNSGGSTSYNCSSDSACSGFNSRNCSNGTTPHCYGGLCHCCTALCSGGSCHCQSFSSCPDLTTISYEGVCLFSTGGYTNQ
jgi:exonuclease VII small subunit